MIVGIILLLITTALVPANGQQTKNDAMPRTRGTTLYVGGSGPGNYTTIQDAIDHAADGDTVYVYHNLSPYHEFLLINTSISLIGEEKNTTIINGDNEFEINIHVTADDVSISGFTVINYGKEAILIESNHTSVSGTILGPHLYGWSGEGIRLYHSHDSLIEENDISNTFYAIEIIDSDHNSIQRNHLNSTNMYGIWLSDASENSIIDNVIDTGDPVGMPGSYNGINLWESTNNTVSGNLLISQDEACRVGIEIWVSRENLIRDNVFEGCGLSWYDSPENTFENNTVNDDPLVFLVGEPHSTVNHAGQVILIDCSDSTVRDVEITNVPKAIEILQSDDCVVTNTTCRNNDYGVYCEFCKNIQVTDNEIFATDIGISVQQGSRDAYVAENIVQDSLYRGIYVYATSTTIERNTLTDNNIGIYAGGLGSLIQFNNVTNNWDGINLYSRMATVKNNAIAGNVNGIHISGVNRNMILSNDITDNICGLNITYDPGSSHGVGNWVMRNNFRGNTRQAFFDSAILTHWRQNYWQGDGPTPVRIDGMRSYYEFNVWGAIIWEKHLPWVNFDWLPSNEPYTIPLML